MELISVQGSGRDNESIESIIHPSKELSLGLRLLPSEKFIALGFPKQFYNDTDNKLETKINLGGVETHSLTENETRYWRELIEECHDNNIKFTCIGDARLLSKAHREEALYERFMEWGFNSLDNLGKMSGNKNANIQLSTSLREAYNKIVYHLVIEQGNFMLKELKHMRQKPAAVIVDKIHADWLYSKVEFQRYAREDLNIIPGKTPREYNTTLEYHAQPNNEAIRELKKIEKWYERAVKEK